MDEIAREAGVSKQTVYSHFGDKGALFEATIREKCEALVQPILAPQPVGEAPRDALTAIARRFLDLILATENMDHFRAIVAESRRFPELAEAFHRSGPQAAVTHLARYLGDLDRRDGFAVADPERAARLFFAMLRGDLYLRRLLDLEDAPDSTEIDAVVAQAVDVFLAGHTAA
jgi:TetR/AcrR family transcriptional repressor of mexJK operon